MASRMARKASASRSGAEADQKRPPVASARLPQRLHMPGLGGWPLAVGVGVEAPLPGEHDADRLDEDIRLEEHPPDLGRVEPAQVVLAVG